MSEAEAKLEEAKEITKTAKESLIDFQAAREYFSNAENTLDKSVKNTKPKISTDIQELLAAASVNLKNSEMSPGKADGWFGWGTEKALNAYLTHIWVEANGTLTANVYTRLIQDSGIPSYKEAVQNAKERNETNAREFLSRIDNLDQIKDLNDDETKQVQKALQTLGYYTIAVDGNFGPGSTAAWEAYQEQVALDNRTPQEIEQIEQSEHALNALEGIKADKTAVKFIQESVGVWADWIVWPNTRKAVSENPEKALNAIAAYIDKNDNQLVAERLKKEAPKNAEEIKKAFEEANSMEEREQVIKKYTGDVDADTRNKNAQFIALLFQNIGWENDARAQELVEMILAEGAGHYEQETTELQLRQALVDGSGRFARHLWSFPENFSGSYYKIRQTLQSRSGRSQVENGMEEGISGTAGDITKALFGVDGEYLATRVHILTGKGTDGSMDTSIELAGGVQLSNAYYDEASGAIYAVVAKGNGCEGNLVVIPVETFVKPKPKPVVRKTVAKAAVTANIPRSVVEADALIKLEKDDETCEPRKIPGTNVFQWGCEPDHEGGENPGTPETPSEPDTGFTTSPWAENDQGDESTWDNDTDQGIDSDDDGTEIGVDNDTGEVTWWQTVWGPWSSNSPSDNSAGADAWTDTGNNSAGL